MELYFWMFLNILVHSALVFMFLLGRHFEIRRWLFVLGNPVECWLENEPLYGYMIYKLRRILLLLQLSTSQNPWTLFLSILPLDTYFHICRFWLQVRRCTLRPYYCREHSIRANRWLHFCGSLTGAQRGKGGRFSRWWFQMFHIYTSPEKLPSFPIGKDRLPITIFSGAMLEFWRVYKNI